MIKLGLILFSCLSVSFSAFASEEMMTETESTSTTMAAKTTSTAPEATAQAATDKSEATVLTVTKAEDQIPLTIDAIKKPAETEPMSTRLLMTGVIISALLGTAYYFVKKYKISNTINKSNMQIKVLSQHYLGPKKSLAIVRVAGESILIGVTDSNISMIKSLSLLDDEIPAETPQNFSEAMITEDNKNLNYTAAAKKAVPAKTMQTSAMGATSIDELEEEFSFSGLKDSVSKKLKSMRSI